MTKPLILMSLLAAFGALAADPKLEPVRVEQIVTEGSDGVLQVRVASGGCTNAADFRIDVATEARGRVATIVRLKPDTCEAYAPMGTTVRLVSKELAGRTPFFIANPLFIGDAKKH